MSEKNKWWRTGGLILSAPNNMTKEEKRQREKERYHDWYWNRGGREKRHARLREVGPYKWGTARDIPSKVY